MQLSMSELHPAAVRLLERMTGPPPSHSRFVGAPIDLAELDPLALGDLWTVARSMMRGTGEPSHSLAEATAEAVVDRGRQVGVVAVPWLPYDEALLETICHAAIEIARRANV